MGLKVAKLSGDADIATVKATAYGHGIGPLFQSTLSNINDTSLVVKENSGQEFKETKKATAAVKAFFDHSDSTLNGTKEHPGLFPQFILLTVKAQNAMDSLDKAIKNLNNLEGDIRGEITAIHLATDQLTGAVIDLREFGKAENPKVDGLLDQLNIAVMELNMNLKQADALLVSGTATAEDIQAIADKIKEQYMKARNLYYALAKELLGVGSQGIQFFLRK